MRTELNTLGLRLFIARRCGQASKWERQSNIAHARQAIRTALKRPIWEANAMPQRDALNRRQMRALVEGVAVYRERVLFGETFNERAW